MLLFLFDDVDVVVVIIVGPRSLAFRYGKKEVISSSYIVVVLFIFVVVVVEDVVVDPRHLPKNQVSNR